MPAQNSIAVESYTCLCVTPLVGCYEIYSGNQMVQSGTLHSGNNFRGEIRGLLSKALPAPLSRVQSETEFFARDQ